MKRARNPPAVHAPLARYSHQILIDGPERLLVLSGQVGMTREGRVPEHAAEQLDLALSNLLQNLDAADMAVTDLVKLTLYLTEPIDPARRAAILTERLGSHTPCMTLLYVTGLASPALKIEVDAWASATHHGDAATEGHE